jgi:phenylalanyl-tRNA synthetase beta chain
MKLSYQWLKKLVKFNESPEKLAKLLTMTVAQVENVIPLNKNLDNVIAVKIIEINPHPNADKLKIATVVFPDKKSKQDQRLEIVCGAPNIKVGQIVPLAKPGAKLPNGMEIKDSIIRGVKSVGMLCAEDELCLGEDHNGILVLSDKFKVGEPITKLLELDDTLLDVENKSLTHRPDLFSVEGFAKEIAAIKGQKVKESLIKLPKIKSGQRKVNIKVGDDKLCPRYMAVIMDSIKIAPSPTWLQNLLRNLDIKPINNVVDITNYVLLEIGQPLHAFDLDKIDKNLGHQSAGKNKNIFIRLAKKGEQILALDSKTYECQESDLVIADSSGPVALAGIIGGEHSAIDEKTKTIMIEAALFEPATIRRASWRIGLRTEAVLRFEKGLPINFSEQGLARAIELIKELAHGKVVSQIYDVRSAKINNLIKNKKVITLDIERVYNLIGAKINVTKIISILRALGFGVKKVSNRKLHINIPLSRPDVEQAEDLVEDIVRIYGLDHLMPEPMTGQIMPVEYDVNFKLEAQAKITLAASGFDEVYNYSFYGDKLIKLLKLKVDDHLSLANPLSPQLKYLRISLIPYLLENALKNMAIFSQFKIFEVGRIYQLNQDNLVREEKYCSGIVIEKNKKLFYSIKSAVEVLLSRVGFSSERISFQIGKNHQYQYLKDVIGIFIDKKLIGVVGEISDNLRLETKITSNAGIFEINLDSLKALDRPTPMFKEISSYPPILRDLSFIVSKSTVLADLLKAIKAFHPLISDVEAFDLFESDKLGAGVLNIAFHLTFQSFEKTLTSQEIDKIINDLVKLLADKFNTKLRNF